MKLKLWFSIWGNDIVSMHIGYLGFMGHVLFYGWLETQVCSSPLITRLGIQLPPPGGLPLPNPSRNPEPW